MVVSGLSDPLPVISFGGTLAPAGGAARTAIVPALRAE
jgi:hypothetical protein